MIVRSLQVGAITTHEYEGRDVPTGFFKHQAEGPRLLGRLGFEGDQQADLKAHGGPDKAALIYPWEHYAYWSRLLGQEPGQELGQARGQSQELGPAFMGENLTVEGLTEEAACIGDVYRLGEALVQVSQPRVPCFKVNIRSGRPDMLQLAMDSLYTGYYVRVLEEGRVAAGDRFTLVRRPAGAPTVAWANQIRHREKGNVSALQRLLAAEGLADAWREPVRKLIARAEHQGEDRQGGRQE